MIKKVIAFPLVLEPIPKEVEEEDDEDEEDNLPLNQWNWIAKATKEE